MKLVLISDTHEKHYQLAIPECDALIHAGDSTFRGDAGPAEDFLNWIHSRPCGRAIIIAGNHDWNWYRPESNKWREHAKSLGIDYLQDSGVEIGGVKFWGSPWQPEFPAPNSWAFNLPRGDKLREKWDMIPEDTNVLITHGPPHGILDLCPDGRRVGCHDLKTKVMKLPELKIHVFGHIHHSYGESNGFGKTKFVNASICDERYVATNFPIVVEI